MPRRTLRKSFAEPITEFFARAQDVHNSPVVIPTDVRLVHRVVH
jgi:hypothetical protein